MKLLCLFLLAFMPSNYAPFERNISVPPPSTPVQENMLRQLGDDSFVKRQQALKYFQDNTADSLLVLKKGVSDNDAQVRDSCKIVLNRFCRVDIKNVPIWYLSNDLRFKDDEDIALKYFTEAFSLVHDDNRNIMYWDWDSSLSATKLYVTDLLLQGATQKQIDDLITEMAFNQKFLGFDAPGTEGAFIMGFHIDIPKNVIPSPLRRRFK